MRTRLILTGRAGDGMFFRALQLWGHRYGMRPVCQCSMYDGRWQLDLEHSTDEIAAFLAELTGKAS